MNPSDSVSVIIPAYNEGRRITHTLEAITQFSASFPLLEILVVDDGSSDDTKIVCEQFMRRLPLRIISHEVNRGKGSAVNTGMIAARGTWRLFMDADNSVSISVLPQFLSVAKLKNADVVIASIELPGASIDAVEDAWYRRMLGKLSKYLIRIAVLPEIYDTQRGFKLFTSRAVEEIFPLQTIHRWGFDIELLVIAKIHGCSIIELPVAWNNPGQSKVQSFDYLTTLFELFRIMRNKLMGRYA